MNQPTSEKSIGKKSLGSDSQNIKLGAVSFAFNALFLPLSVLVNSYSSLKTHLRYHFILETFHDSP